MRRSRTEARTVIWTIAVFASALAGQGPLWSGQAAGASHGVLTNCYYQAVLEAIRPPGWQESRVTISFGDEFKYILRTNGKRFVLLKGSPAGDIYKQLQSLDLSRRLPPDPGKAVDLVSYTWKTTELSAAEFNRLHQDFTSALTQYVSAIQTRYAKVLEKGGVLHLHTPQYLVVYDNRGFEHVSVEAWDDTQDPAKASRIIAWVHTVQNLAGKTGDGKAGDVF